MAKNNELPKVNTTLSGKTVKMKSLRPCHVSKNDVKNGLVFRYKYIEAGDVKEIPVEHKKIMLDTGLFVEVK